MSGCDGGRVGALNCWAIHRLWLGKALGYIGMTSSTMAGIAN